MEKCIGNYRFEINFVLGRGSFGNVFQGTDQTGIHVAGKQVDFRDEKKALNFAEKMEKLKMLDHRNIVKVFDVINHKENSIWIVMECCDKGDLGQYFEATHSSGTNVPKFEQLSFMLDTSRGVEYLHRKNVVHRDIKPSNVLLFGSPTTAKLTDFDCSKFIDEEGDAPLRRVNGATNTSILTSGNVGTMAFKAPEFYLRTTEGKLQYDHTVDIFSLGLTFLAIMQNNPYLVPKIETPNEAAELSPGYTIGMLIAERIRYKVKPLQVVKIMESTDPEHQLWNEIRRHIMTMTHVEPAQRPSAAQVVLKLETLVQKQVNNKNTEPRSNHCSIYPSKILGLCLSTFWSLLTKKNKSLVVSEMYRQHKSSCPFS